MHLAEAGDRALELTVALVAIDSVNPGLVPGAAGERAAAEFAADRLAAAGFDVSLVDPDGHPGRTSAVAVREFGPGPTVVLNGHLDTVGVDGMDDPFRARADGDRLYGRGACDMKAGVAGMVAAAEALAAEPPRGGRLVLALVADEEDASLGTESVIPWLADRGVAGDVCIVGEPSWLDLAVAHRGFALMRARLLGRAAHTSRPWDGADAIAALGRLILGVEALDADLRASTSHPLVGHGSATVSVVRAGSAPFTIAAEAEAILERRTLPGESLDGIHGRFREVVEAACAQVPGVRAELEPLIARPGWQAGESGLIQELADSLRDGLSAAGRPEPARVGAPYWMESALWEEAGVPSLVFGPAGGALHAIDEWVDISQVRAYAQALVPALASMLAS